MNEAYPTKQKKVRNTDDPWIDDAIRKKIRSRKRTFDRQFRSDKWKEKKYLTNKMISEAKAAFYEKFTKLAKETGDSSLYYKIVARLKDRRAPEAFCVTSLYPKKPEAEVAELVADFFCSISEKFTPITDSDLPPHQNCCLLYTSPSPRDRQKSRMPSSA